MLNPCEQSEHHRNALQNLSAKLTQATEILEDHMLTLIRDYGPEFGCPQATAYSANRDRMNEPSRLETLDVTMSSHALEMGNLEVDVKICGYLCIGIIVA